MLLVLVPLQQVSKHQLLVYPLQQAVQNAVASSTGSVAIGEQSKATAGYGLAIGAKAKAEHSSSVALGNGSETKQAKSVKNATVNNLSYDNFAGTDATATVSVGATQNAQYTRQIVNVGAGEISKTSTDAINGLTTLFRYGYRR